MKTQTVPVPQTEFVPLDSVFPDPANVRRRDQRAVDAIKASLVRFGQQTPIVCDVKRTIRKGNGTWQAAKELGWAEIEVRWTDLKGSEATAYSVADNRTSDLSSFDDTALAETLRALQSEDFPIEAAGFTDAEVDELLEGLARDAAGADEGSGPTDGPDDPAAARLSLADRFVVPPFSVLDARQGYWQDRKRKWLALGIRSELGRGDNALGREAECEAYRDGDGEYRKEGGMKSTCNDRDWIKAKGLSGLAQDAHVKSYDGGGYACPGGSPRPAMKLGGDGRTRRGDGRGRAIGDAPA